MQCLICGGKSTKKAFVKEGRDFFSCGLCGLVFIYPTPSPEEREALYEKTYYDPWEAAGKGRSASGNKKTTFNNWLNLIEKFSSGGAVLDIGCAMGFFLEVARGRGWQVYGVEISEYSSDIAKKEFGSSVSRGALEDAHFAAEKFDLVTMFDLIEHIEEPKGFLAEVRRTLKPKGIIAISTPDTKSLFCKLMARNWPHFKAEHLYYYNAKNLSALLRSMGFEILHLSPAHKLLSLNYIRSYSQAYSTPVLRGASSFLCSILPGPMCNSSLNISSGEMLLIARKAIK